MKHLYLSIFASVLTISLNTKTQETEAQLDDSVDSKTKCEKIIVKRL